jgi:hypothetical protein
MGNIQNTSAVKDSAYCGEVVYIFAYDLAYDTKREQVKELLGMPTREYTIEPDKRSPKQLFFYRPQMAVLPEETKKVGGKLVPVKKSIKLFNVGAVSIQIRVPFEVENLKELVRFHNIDIDGRPLEDEARALAQEILEEIRPFCIKPASSPGQSENYTVFCIKSLPQAAENTHLSGEQWLMENRRQAAALLTEEQNAADLSGQEMTESTELYLTYYDSDLVVIDWDAALVLGERETLDDVLHIMEMANIQLVELEAYDRIMDAALEVAYRDVSRRRTRFNREIHRNLREIRVDLARLSDEFLNVTKFFGDWHFARIYQHLSKRFHLSDWHRIIQEKQKTLGDLYQLLQQDANNFLMVVLEMTIVLLFIIDLVLLFLQK